MWKFFEQRDRRVTQISCIRTGYGHKLCLHPAVYRCGVVYVYFCLGFSTTFQRINELTSHFLIILIDSIEVVLSIICYFQNENKIECVVDDINDGCVVIMWK